VIVDDQHMRGRIFLHRALVVWANDATYPFNIIKN